MHRYTETLWANIQGTSVSVIGPAPMPATPTFFLPVVSENCHASGAHPRVRSASNQWFQVKVCWR